MFSGHLRELVLYERTTNGEVIKKREVVPSFYQPSSAHEVFSGPRWDPRRVFTPDGNFLPIWGLVMLLTILCQAIIVPFMMAFGVDDTLETAYADFVCTVVYMLDIAVTCNTGFYKKGLLVDSRRKIWSKYLRSWFFLDVVSTFPYDWLFQEPLNPTHQTALRAASVVRVFKLGRLLRSLRLVRLMKVRTYLVRVRQKLMDSKLAIAFTAVYLLTIMLGLAHWVACGFYAISLTVDTTDTWIFQNNLQDEDVMDQYIAALYWAITTLTTTGYGDIHPIHTNEKLYGIGIMIISAGVFSFIIGKIGSAIASVDRDSKEHKDLTLAVTAYLNHARVPRRTITRATEYIDYEWEARKKRQLLDNNVMQHFSSPLQHEINCHIYAPLISRVPLFSKFGHAIIGQLASSITPEVMAPEDSVFFAGQKNCEIYFIEKGKVNIYHDATKYSYTILGVSATQAGAYFGELAFFTESPRCASARCIDFTELLCLKRDYFMSLLTPDLMYTYLQIQDIYNAGDYYAMGMACYLCQATNHLAPECPKSRVKKDRMRIWHKWMIKKSTSVAIIPGVTEPNYERRERKVRRGLRFSLDNVKRGEDAEEVKHIRVKKALKVWRGRYMEDFMSICNLPEARLTTESGLQSSRHGYQSDINQSIESPVRLTESALSMPIPRIKSPRRQAWKPPADRPSIFVEDV